MKRLLTKYIRKPFLPSSFTLNSFSKMKQIHPRINSPITFAQYSTSMSTQELKTEKGKKVKETKLEETFVYVNETPKGEKKDFTKITPPKEYQPKYVEAAWYDWWEAQGYFKPENDSKKPAYVITIPPPNVTGSLHIGHALTVSIEDCLIRWHRMKGFNCLYLPGVDHAGIATQVVVEKRLKRMENKTRHDIGREAFLKETFKWKEQYGHTITNQLRRVGASLDWTRECFTMDEKLSKAVNESFVLLYEKGLIYREDRLVNWDCTLTTAISNIEVDHKEIEKKTKLSVANREKKKYEFGALTSFAYIVEGTNEEIVVATTRPETMLGDSAIAVHPDDKRFKHLVGKVCVHPFNGRKIPIIADKMVEIEFGSGAVKITPAHDFNDFECGKRHNLPRINILNDNGTLNENGAPWTGVDRLDARALVIKALEEKKLFRGSTDHKYSVGFCQRSDDVVEPYLKPQWYFNCTDLAKQSIEAVKSGKLKIIPEFHEAKWYHWLENIRDWCISRQLWWGHRIPAYYCVVDGVRGDSNDQKYWVVGRTEKEALENAAKRFGVSADKIKLEQDEDVLDTWFSSGLFPFSTMGWPDATPDMKDFYPNSILETGSDILFFWVARMVFMGLALTDKLPFDKVYLHAMVRDKFGRKMSKSLGNVIDPLDVIESISLEKLNKKLEEGNLPKDEIEKAKKGQQEQFPEGIKECGTDALRFTMLNFISPAVRDINMDVGRVFGYRTFCNKMYQTVAFAGIYLTDFVVKEAPNSKMELSFIDRWILDRLNSTIDTSIKSLESYNFAAYTSCVYEFWMKELCSVYLEVIKPTMNGSDKTKKEMAQLVLFTCIETCLRLLHPTMPFVTEELWQRLAGNENKPCASIMIAPYPATNNDWVNSKVEKEFEIVMEIIKRIRSVKASYNLTNAVKVPIVIECAGHLVDLIKMETGDISVQAFCGDVKIISKEESKPEGGIVEFIDETLSVYVILKGYLNIETEMKKLEKNKDELMKAVVKLEESMKSKNYDKVPEAVKIANVEKVSKYKADIDVTEKAMESLKLLK
jgi:valyl-tRNA synthetase